MELDFLTHVAYEKAIRKANGEVENVEEYETDTQSFSEDVKELMGDDYDPSEWEVVEDG